jgi:hypothetical protein
MWGWFSEAITLASRSKRSLNRAAETLTATLRCHRVSVAR